MRGDGRSDVDRLGGGCGRPGGALVGVSMPKGGTTMLKSWLLGSSLVAFVALPAVAQDAEEGEKVFKKCQACHVIDKEQNRVGPHLVGIIGRKAGSVEGFKYSDAMKESGKVWDEATIDAYLADPKGYIPKNKMAFAGLKKPEERAAVIAYLKEEAGGGS
jgi:cytochrome c